MTPKEALTKYLEKVPEARERAFKDKHIVSKLKEKYPNIEDNLLDFVKDYTLYDRYWRKILEERKDLRGKDYEDKVVLSQAKVLDLDYEVGHHQDVKTLNKYQLFDKMYKEGKI